MGRSTSAEYLGCRLSYHVEGSGPPVVLIQGVGVSGRGWTPQVRGLSSRFQCLTFDNRGMGESQPLGAAITVRQMAEDTLWLMTQLGWDSAHVVGHSLGGPVALEMALSQPERVRSLSLLCTLARGRDATRLTWKMLVLGLRTRIGPRRARRRAFLEMVMPPDALARQDADALAAELEPLFGHDLADQPPVAMKQLAALRAYDASDRLATLAAIPTLVMSAAHDPIAPPRHGRALAEAIPGARYHEFDDASHGLPIQHAERVNRLLLDHLLHAESARSAVARQPEPDGINAWARTMRVRGARFPFYSVQEARMALHARGFTLPVLLLGLTLAAPPRASAQTDTALVTTTTTHTEEDDDNDFPWGLLGLLGLLGLIPKRRKEVHVHDHEVHTRPVTPRDPPPPPRDPMPPHNPPRP